jgi:hypothetical protein
MENTANIMAILAGVLATIVTSVITFMATRAAMKNDDRRLELDSKRTDRDFATLDTEQAERLGAVSMNLINSMQSQYGDCLRRSTELDALLEEAKKRITLLERAMRRHLRDLPSWTTRRRQNVLQTCGALC